MSSWLQEAMVAPFGRMKMHEEALLMNGNVLIREEGTTIRGILL